MRGLGPYPYFNQTPAPMATNRTMMITTVSHGIFFLGDFISEDYAPFVVHYLPEFFKTGSVCRPQCRFFVERFVLRAIFPILFESSLGCSQAVRQWTLNPS